MEGILLKKYIDQAKEEVARWPEWKKAHLNIWCSEDIEKEKQERFNRLVGIKPEKDKSG